MKGKRNNFGDIVSLINQSRLKSYQQKDNRRWLRKGYSSESCKLWQENWNKRIFRQKSLVK